MDDIGLGVEVDTVFPLDPWAQCFVWLIDDSGSFCDDMPVAAPDALCFLYAACGAYGLVLQEG
jgi:hypothetical protein